MLSFNNIMTLDPHGLVVVVMLFYHHLLKAQKMSSLFCVAFSCNLCPKLWLVCSCLLSSVCSLIEVSASIPDPCALAASGAVPNSSTTLVLLLPVSPPICRCR